MALNYISLKAFIYLAQHIWSEQTIILDDTITKHIYSFRSPTTTQLNKFISLLGYEFAIIITLTLITALIIKNKKIYAFSTAIIFIFNGIFNLLLKSAFQRPRPTDNPLVTEQFYSFPSGHSMTAFVTYTLVCYFTYRFIHNPWLKYTIISTSILIILLVGISRVYLGVHYPSDVIAAYIASFWWLINILFIRRTLKFFGHKSEA